MQRKTTPMHASCSEVALLTAQRTRMVMSLEQLAARLRRTGLEWAADAIDGVIREDSK